MHTFKLISIKNTVPKESSPQCTGHNLLSAVETEIPLAQTAANRKSTIKQSDYEGKGSAYFHKHYFKHSDKRSCRLQETY